MTKEEVAAIVRAMLDRPFIAKQVKIGKVQLSHLRDAAVVALFDQEALMRKHDEEVSIQGIDKRPNRGNRRAGCRH